MLLTSNVAVSLIRNLVRPEVRIPVFVMVIVVTAVELAMHAFLPGLYTVLGIFIPLIVTNCCVIRPRRGVCVQERRGEGGGGWDRHWLGVFAGAGV